MPERVPPFNLTDADHKYFVDFCKRYYASDSYKQSQKYLRDLVRKNTQSRYNLTVPKPPEK